MTEIALKCTCGEVTGLVENATSSSGTRVVCCCSDCQAFAASLNRENDILDEFGGTEIYQTSMSQLKLLTGHDKLKSMRLSEKGLLRWYTSCCNTPIGNTIKAGMPFVGIIHNFIDLPDRDSTLGAVRAYVQTQHAIGTGTPTYPHHSAKFPPGITARIIVKMLTWKLKGMHKPSVFFNEEGRPVSEPTIASRK